MISFFRKNLATFLVDLINKIAEQISSEIV